MRQFLLFTLGFCLSFGISSMLHAHKAFGEDWSHGNQVFERPSHYTEDMRCEDPDWSEYPIDEFMGLGFANFAEGTVPDYTLNEEQLAYLEDNRPTVIYRSPVKADVIDIAPVQEDEGLIALTRRMFEKEGMTFILIKLM